jgi:hypothetical protein
MCFHFSSIGIGALLSDVRYEFCMYCKMIQIELAPTVIMDHYDCSAQVRITSSAASVVADKHMNTVTLFLK